MTQASTGATSDCAFRWRAPLSSVLAALSLAAAMPAQAALFEDDEARRAILDLRQVNEQQKARIAELTAAVRQLTDQVQQAQRNVLDMNSAAEQLRAELAKLRGQDEQLTRDVSELQKIVRESSQNVDERLRRVEPQAGSAEVREQRAAAEEKRMYEEAIGQLRIGEFDKATVALTAFLRRYPTGSYTDIARYWLGNAQYGRRDYKEAINSFRAFVTAAPTHARAPEAMLAMANCQVEMQDTRAARRTLEELVRTYPQSEAAVAGRDRMTAIR